MHRLAIALLSFCLSWTVAAHAASPKDEIRAALAQWTDDFNAGRADAVCDLFAPALIADVRGAPERDFDTQCRLLRKAIADPERSIGYAFDLKEVLVVGDLAAVRIVWTTTTRDRVSGQVTTGVDQGLDVFGRAGDGSWHIVRYMAYERP
jgi:ketosteroid isomerase-like protein